MLHEQLALNNGLIASAKAGDSNRALHLIFRGADIEARDANCNTPLMIAEMHNNLELAQRLLSEEASPLARNNLGETVLHIAARIGDLPMLDRVLEIEPALLEIPNNRGQTLLSVAIDLNQIEAAERLIALGANAFASDPLGGKPIQKLALMAEQGLIAKSGFAHREIQRLLLHASNDRTMG